MHTLLAQIATAEGDTGEVAHPIPMGMLKKGLLRKMDVIDLTRSGPKARRSKRAKLCLCHDVLLAAESLRSSGPFRWPDFFALS